VAEAEYSVHLSEPAIYDLLNGADGPVYAWLDRISEQAAAVARAKVHVRHTASWKSQTSTAFPPGYTLVSIHSNVHWYNGLLYGGIAAVELPTIFLEYPAEQMHRQYPFMSTAFDYIIEEALL
jgi:hypothetical protein